MNRFRPIEKLRNAVDLIVVSPFRKPQHLMQECGEPGRLFGQIDLAGFEAGALGLHAHELITLRSDTDGHRHAWLSICSQLLNEVQSRAGLLNKDAIGRMFARKRNQLALEIRKYQTPAPDVEQVVGSLDDQPSGGN